MKCRPFIKWAGGKTQLLPKILPLLPRQIDTYWEPFAGGAALFFALASEQTRRFKRAFLFDANEELVNAYVTVRDYTESLAHGLSNSVGTREFFEEMKSWRPTCGIDRAIRFIYLVRFGFNGLWRVNRNGEYNIPFGRRCGTGPVADWPTTYFDNLRACAHALKDVTISVRTFSPSMADPGDFVFLDPPYLPASDNSFTAYTKTGFGIREHVKLIEAVEELRHCGISHVLCNADTPVSRDLCRGLKVIKVRARRSVSGKVKGRKPAREILVVSP